MQTTDKNKMTKGVVMGTVASVASMFIIVFIESMLIYSGKMSNKAVEYGTLITLLLSGLVGSFIAVKQRQEKRILAGLLTELLYGLVLLGITALFFDGIYKGVWITLLTILGMGIIPCLLTSNKAKNKKIMGNYRINR